MRDFYQRYLQNAYCNIPHTQSDCQHRKHAVLCQCLHGLDGHTWSNASLVLNMSAVDHKRQSLLAKFFPAGAHVATEHHSMHSTPYLQRACHLCSSHSPGNEEHVLLGCSATQHIRTQFPVLDFSLSSLRAFLHDQASEVQMYYFVAAVMKFACTVPFHPP